MFLTPEAINEGYERAREHRRKKPEIVEIPRKQLEEILELTLSSGINSKAKIQEIIRSGRRTAMNAREAFERLYAGDYQTAEGAGELARIVSEALNDAESTQSLYYTALDRLEEIKKRGEKVNNTFQDLRDLPSHMVPTNRIATLIINDDISEIINYILNGEVEGK